MQLGLRETAERFFSCAAQDILEEAPLEVESLARKCCILGLLQAAVQHGFPEQSFTVLFARETTLFLVWYLDLLVVTNEYFECLLIFEDSHWRTKYMEKKAISPLPESKL